MAITETAMSESIIICSKCKNKIKLTESLAAPIIEATNQKFEKLLLNKDLEIATHEKAIFNREEQLNKDKKLFSEKLANKIQEKEVELRQEIAIEEARKAKLCIEIELKNKESRLLESQEAIENLNNKLAASQEKEIEFLKKQRLLKDKEREMELTIEQAIQNKSEEIHQKAHKEAVDSVNLKVSEKDLQIKSMIKKIDELKRKAIQGSQQLQGEAQEIEIENILRNHFPDDIIEPVPKGEFGGDIIQYVKTIGGDTTGKILWELKHTKNWSNEWLVKLKNDQRIAKADIAIIVTQALPKDIKLFQQIDNIWIAHSQVSLLIATTLRQLLIKAYSVKTISKGQKSKEELLYQYLIGENFRRRIECIVDAFTNMKIDLDKERKVITKQWSKRQMQIDNVINTAVSMHGDLQGIVGKELQEIEGLELQALGHDSKE